MDQYLSKQRRFVTAEARRDALIGWEDYVRGLFTQNIELAGARVVSPIVVTWERLDEDWVQNYRWRLGRYVPRTIPRAGDWLLTAQAYTTEVVDQ